VVFLRDPYARSADYMYIEFVNRVWFTYKLRVLRSHTGSLLSAHSPERATMASSIRTAPTWPGSPNLRASANISYVRTAAINHHAGAVGKVGGRITRTREGAQMKSARARGDACCGSSRSKKWQNCSKSLCETSPPPLGSSPRAALRQPTQSVPAWYVVMPSSYPYRRPAGIGVRVSVLKSFV
jgi:hypothetical protein